jgi:hypothetical protein
MVRRTKRTKRRIKRRSSQSGGRETVGYFLSLDGFPNAPGASRVDSYSSCSKPTFTLPLDSAFAKASGGVGGQGGGKRRKRRRGRKRRSSRKNKRSRKTRRNKRTRKVRRKRRSN